VGIVERVEPAIETRRRDLQRVTVRDLFGGIEQRRDLARDRLAVLDRDRAAVLALEDQAEDRPPAETGALDPQEPASLLAGDGPDFLGRFLAQLHIFSLFGA
jgi:hypothetical protein